MPSKSTFSSVLLLVVACALFVVVYQQSRSIDKLETQIGYRDSMLRQFERVVESEDNLLLAIDQMRDFEKGTRTRSEHSGWGSSVFARNRPDAEGEVETVTVRRKELLNELHVATLALMERRVDLRAIELRMEPQRHLAKR